MRLRPADGEIGRWVTWPGGLKAAGDETPAGGRRGTAGAGPSDELRVAERRERPGEQQSAADDGVWRQALSRAMGSGPRSVGSGRASSSRRRTTTCGGRRLRATTGGGGDGCGRGGEPEGGGGEPEGDGGSKAAANQKAAAAQKRRLWANQRVAAARRRRLNLDLVSGKGCTSSVRKNLDCIGSAFNAKGVMQCPNCRKIEKGNWLYANGSRPIQDINMDEWAHEEDLYGVSYSEMPFRFHWCPFGRLAQIPSLFEEGESSPPVTFHDFMGQHVFTERAAVSAAPGATHPCPYVAYLHPLPPLASSSSSHAPERTMDGPAYHDHWNPLAGPSDGRPLQTVQPTDFHHNHWAHVPHSYAQPNSNNGVTEQPGVPFGTMRAARVDGNSQRRGSVVSPSFFSNGSGSRSRAPNVPPLVPQLMRAHGSINEQYQQNPSSGQFAGAHRLGGMRPAPPPLPENPAFCLFPPGSSGHGSMETDDAGGSRFYAWERDRFAPYPLMPVDCETSWWSSQQSHGTSEPTPAPRRLFGQWIGVSRSSPENRSPEGSSYRQMHTPRM